MNLDNVIAVRPNKIICRDGDRCIKIFDETYSKADVLHEAFNNARVEESGINIPRLLEVTTVDGKWALVYDYIEGKTLQQMINEDPEGKASYIERLVDIQIDILSHKGPRLVQLKNKMQRKISDSGLDATTRYELHVRLDAMRTQTKLCHGDLDPSNVIIRDDGTPFVIDWAHVTQGNAGADAARTYLLFCLAGDEEGAETYLSTFCRKGDVARQYVQRWMPIVAASQLVKGKAEERELLMSWADVID